MGIQGLLQALKPYVEPVHVNKYSGQRVGIDAYSWLHKGAYGCSWQQVHGEPSHSNSQKMPPYVTYCIHRIKMLQYNNITPVVVFDGGRLPAKAITEQSRRRVRDENLQKAQERMNDGDLLSAKEYFQKAVEITPLMAHELVKVLREERVEYVVAPYEADAQLAHLAGLPPQQGGVTTIITEDSDLLAYGCKVVLFKMDRFGNGEEICLQNILHVQQPPPNALSFRNFTQELFLAMCVLAGCDFLASIPGIGVKKAHALLAKYRNIPRVLDRLKVLKHSAFPEGYISHFWQAKAIFTHARVYERKTRGLRLLNPVPDDLLKKLDGDIEFLGPDLPPSRAQAIANGQLDPTTMCSFDVLPSRTPTSSSIAENLNVEDSVRLPTPQFVKQESMWAMSTRFQERSEVVQSWTESLKTVPTQHDPDDEHFLEMLEVSGVDDMSESGFTISSPSTLMSDTPPEIDQQLLSELQLIAFSGSGPRADRKGQVDLHPPMPSRVEITASEHIPQNNPFKRHRVGEKVAFSEKLPHASSELLEVKLECVENSSGLCSPSAASSFDESQMLSRSGDETLAESVDAQPRTAFVSSPPVDVAKSRQEQMLLDENVHLSDTGSCESQFSVHSSSESVLSEISPNIPESVSRLCNDPTNQLQTPTSGSHSKPFIRPSVGKKSKSKSSRHVDRPLLLRGKTSGGPQSRPPWDGGILRFFKPIPIL